VIGLGLMGMCSLVILKALGARVIVADLNENRLKKAEKLGADRVINPKQENSVRVIREFTEGEGVHKVIECSGSAKGVDLALNAAAKQAIVAQIGECKEVTISPRDQFVRKKLTYIGNWYFPLGEWKEITNFLVNRIGDEKIKSMISHKIPLKEERVQKIFTEFNEHKTLKVVFTP
jgi:propanol-preferring alcohol dehydrogenase